MVCSHSLPADILHVEFYIVLCIFLHAACISWLGSVTVRTLDRVTTCLENLEMSGNLKRVREMSGMLLTVRELSGKKSCRGKVSQNCSLLDEYLRSYGYLSHP